MDRQRQERPAFPKTTGWRVGAHPGLGQSQAVGQRLGAFIAARKPAPDVAPDCNPPPLAPRASHGSELVAELAVAPHEVWVVGFRPTVLPLQLSISGSDARSNLLKE